MTNRIQQAFEKVKAKGEKALIPYIMAGDPSLEETETLVLTLAESGADLIEMGVPFSDPIDDGPVIQQAAKKPTCPSSSCPTTTPSWPWDWRIFAPGR